MKLKSPEHDEPIYDNLTNIINKQKSSEDLTSDEDLLDHRNRSSVHKRTSSDAPKRSAPRKTTVISSHDADDDDNSSNSVVKLAYSKSMKYTDSDKTSLVSPSSSNDLNKKISCKILTSAKTTSEPTWREMALKKQSAWINNQNGSVENLLNSNNNNNNQHNEVIHKFSPKINY